MRGPSRAENAHGLVQVIHAQDQRAGGTFRIAAVYVVDVHAGSATIVRGR